MQKTLKETNLRWIGYAYFAVGVFAFVLLQGHPLSWLRYVFIALSMTAAWYFILFHSGQRLWLEDGRMFWNSRSGGLSHSGSCAISDIHHVVLYRFSGRRKEDGDFTRVMLKMLDGTRVPLPTGLRLGEGRFANLEDVVEALRRSNPRLVVQIEREAPDFELWDEAAIASKSNGKSNAGAKAATTIDDDGSNDELVKARAR